MFLKGHYKSDKPDGVIPREEAEVRHYAMETSISGGIVATSDPTFLSLSTRPTHGVVVRACDTRENKSARRKSVSRRTLERCGCFTHTIRWGFVSNAYADRVYSYPHPAAPLTGQPLPILDQLIGSAYVSTFQRNVRFSCTGCPRNQEEFLESKLKAQQLSRSRFSRAQGCYYSSTIYN